MLYVVLDLASAPEYITPELLTINIVGVFDSYAKAQIAEEKIKRTKGHITEIHEVTEPMNVMQWEEY